MLIQFEGYPPVEAEDIIPELPPPDGKSPLRTRKGMIEPLKETDAGLKIIDDFSGTCVQSKDLKDLLGILKRADFQIKPTEKNTYIIQDRRTKEFLFIYNQSEDRLPPVKIDIERYKLLPFGDTQREVNG